jgi:exonuclease III
METMTIATYNIRGINQKMSEKNDFKKRKTEILMVREIEKKTKGTEEMDGCIFIYSVA